MIKKIYLFKITKDCHCFLKGQKVWAFLKIWTGGDSSTIKAIGRFRKDGRWISVMIHDYSYKFIDRIDIDKSFYKHLKNIENRKKCFNRRSLNWRNAWSFKTQRRDILFGKKDIRKLVKIKLGNCLLSHYEIDRFSVNAWRQIHREMDKMSIKIDNILKYE